MASKPIGSNPLPSASKLSLSTSSYKSTKSTSGEFLNVGFELVLNFLGLVVGTKFNDDASHTLGNLLDFTCGLFTVCDLRMLVNRVERLEAQELDTSMSMSGITDGTNNISKVSWFSVRDMYAARSIASSGEKGP